MIASFGPGASDHSHFIVLLSALDQHVGYPIWKLHLGVGKQSESKAQLAISAIDALRHKCIKDAAFCP